MMECPCKDCSKRQLFCHSKCDGYKEWRVWLDKKNFDERVKKAIDRPSPPYKERKR